MNDELRSPPTLPAPTLPAPTSRRSVGGESPQ